MLLLQTQLLLNTTKVSFQSFADLRGEKTAVYQFNVAAEDSLWDLSASGSHYRIPFSHQGPDLSKYRRDPEN